MRVLIATIGFMGAIFFPPWVPLIAIALLSLRWRAWEALALGVFVDFLYLPPGLFGGAVPWFTIAAFIIVWGLEPVRSEFLFS